MFTFEFSCCSIIRGSLQSSSSHQSGTFLSALCSNRSPSNQLLFVYFIWFCAFDLDLITKKNEDFAFSRAAVKLKGPVQSTGTRARCSGTCTSLHFCISFLVSCSSYNSKFAADFSIPPFPS